MELELRELRMLSDINCYDNDFELTKEEINDDEKETYMNDWDNLRKNISDWFCSYLSERVYIREYNGKTFYFFRRGSSLICGFEYENLVDRVLLEKKPKSVKEFNEVVYEIFQENEYDPADDWFDEYDDEEE